MSCSSIAPRPPGSRAIEGAATLGASSRPRIEVRLRAARRHATDHRAPPFLLRLGDRRHQRDGRVQHRSRPVVRLLDLRRLDDRGHRVLALDNLGAVRGQHRAERADGGGGQPAGGPLGGAPEPDPGGCRLRRGLLRDGVLGGPRGVLRVLRRPAGAGSGLAHDQRHAAREPVVRDAPRPRDCADGARLPALQRRAAAAQPLPDRRLRLARGVRAARRAGVGADHSRRRLPDPQPAGGRRPLPRRRRSPAADRADPGVQPGRGPPRGR